MNATEGKTLYQKLPASCKFCGKTLELKVDRRAWDTMDQVYWLSVACCNRCADIKHSEQKRRDILEKLWPTLNFLVMSRLRYQKIDPELRQIEEMTRRRLISATKLYGELVAKETGKPNRWEPFLVDGIMQVPKRFDELVKTHLVA